MAAGGWRTPAHPGAPAAGTRADRRAAPRAAHRGALLEVKLSSRPDGGWDYATSNSGCREGGKKHHADFSATHAVRRGPGRGSLPVRHRTVGARIRLHPWQFTAAHAAVVDPRRS